VTDEVVQRFELLTGFQPMSWQHRLYREYFEVGRLPDALDVPTGLGKTSVMALWYMAFSARVPGIPRRLVYVVDRRAVVDQATTVAEQLRDRCGEALTISTLRGQFVDNRAWTADPTRPAIIVGTVDMVGSRLLFSGYAVSPKMRPYHAGLLGVDSLIVLDEAHLVPPFEHLLGAIAGRPEFGPVEGHDFLPSRMHLMSLSATGRARPGLTFALTQGDGRDPVVARRLTASKRVAVIPADGKLVDVIVAQAWRLAGEDASASRCLVYVNARKDADAVRKTLGLLTRKAGLKPPLLLVGARRVFERERAYEDLTDAGFVAGSKRDGEPRFLVATSAGEVGVDLDADHMICDVVAWERMVQRLGRVNRLGVGSAEVVVVDQAPDAKEVVAAQRHQAVVALIGSLPALAGGSRDASLGALIALRDRARIDEGLQRLWDEAVTPEPFRPEITRALVDAWSMTSAPVHTGRPEDVGPWLRGWTSDPPGTTVVWRKHLPVRQAGSRIGEVAGFFDAAPPHLSEQLEVDAFVVVDWLIKRAKKLEAGWRHHPAGGGQGSLDASASADTPADASAQPGAEGSAGSRPHTFPGGIVAIVLDSSGEPRPGPDGRGSPLAYTIRDLVRVRPDELRDLLGSSTLVVDSRLAGLADGLLDPEEDGVPLTADSGVWIKGDPPVPPFRVVARTQQEAGADGSWREVFQFVIESGEEDMPTAWLGIDQWRSAASDEDDRAVGPSWQSLDGHQRLAASRARELAARQGLPADVAIMLESAAGRHDEGKRSTRWQDAFHVDQARRPAAKSPRRPDIRRLGGYRHEFGTVLAPSGSGPAEPTEVAEDFRHLCLELIAAHHGYGRPVMPVAGADRLPPALLAGEALEVARRWARLQASFGPWGLAWLESLLRAADQQASAAGEFAEAANPKATQSGGPA